MATSNFNFKYINVSSHNCNQKITASTIEKSTIPLNLYNKARFLIIYPLQKYPINLNKSIKDIAKQANDIVKEVISYIKADYNKATLLGLFLLARQSYIVFDYDNPGHSDCRVLGFKIK